jgi:hypothetical protein
VPRVGYRFVARAEASTPEGGEERSPYPGLSSFTSRDSSFFFGREGEVESLRRKLGDRSVPRLEDAAFVVNLAAVSCRSVRASLELAMWRFSRSNCLSNFMNVSASW